MTEPELRQKWYEFFFRNPAGKELFKRWDQRVKNAIQETINSEDKEKREGSRHMVRAFQTIVLPEITASRTTYEE